MANVKENVTLDVKGAKCPMPIVRAKKEMDLLAPDEVLRVLTTDKGSVLDFQGWAKTNPKVELVEQETIEDEDGKELYVHYLRKR